VLRKTADRDTEWGIDDILDSKKEIIFMFMCVLITKNKDFFI
jgi:hypothetical protein